MGLKSYQKESKLERVAQFMEWIKTMLDKAKATIHKSQKYMA